MDKVKVLPVYPEFPLTFWSFKRAVEYLPGKKAAMPPTGLATVMAMMPEDRFDLHRIIDLNVEPLTDEQIKNNDVVFTSTMIVQDDSHKEVVDRAHFYGKKVVAGGPFATTYPERTRSDYIVSGEAEVTLIPFLEDYLDGAKEGVWTEKSVAGRNKLVQLTKGGKTTLDRTPLPRWDLLDLGAYNSAAVQYSRGCPFDCDFCDITKMFGKESRTKTPEQMVRELDALYKAEHRGSVFIVDDNFIGNRKEVLKLLPKVEGWQKDHDYPFNLFTEASENLAWTQNEGLLNGMYDAGFDTVFVGIESVDEEVLKKMQKGQNTKIPQDQMVQRIQSAGLEVLAGFIIGSDGEKPEAFDNLFNFIQQEGITTPMPGLLTALKGTDLYKRLESEGRIRKESSGNNTHDLHFNFEPEMNERELIEGYKGLIEKLFKPRNYYERCRTLQERTSDKLRGSKRGKDGLIAFGRSLRRQLLAKGGLEYAKYLGETALRNPKYFPKAVTEAIKLDHFKGITEETLRAHDYIPTTETMYERFSLKARDIYSESGREIHERVDLIANKAHQIIRKAERKYEKLHKDFRGGAELALEKLRERIQEEVDNYRVKLTA
jgi:radical SAM superfamily enzyme YgiQ (UPF0313 family)